MKVEDSFGIRIPDQEALQIMVPTSRKCRRSSIILSQIWSGWMLKK